MIYSLTRSSVLTTAVTLLLNNSNLFAHEKTLPLFFAESKEHPAATLNPGQMKIKVSKKKRQITMDAVYLSEGVKFSAIKKAAAEIDHYDEIAVPGVEESKKIQPSIFWMHSETLGVHSRDFFHLVEHTGLDGNTAMGLNWIPAKKEKNWEEKQASRFNNFAGYFYLKLLPQEANKAPLVYIRYALEFDMDSAVPPAIIKMIVDFKGRSLAEGYIDAIIKAASMIQGQQKKP